MKITATDMDIIRCLQDDARMSVVQIAKLTGVPESTVRNRLSRLTDGGILSFVAVTDPLKLGYQLWVMMTIQTELTRMHDVAQSLAELPEIYFVAVMTGGYDIIVSASFRSNEDFLSFISTRLSRIPGIVRTANYSLLKIYKRAMDVPPPAAFELSDDGAESGATRTRTKTQQPRRHAPAGSAADKSRRRRPANGS